MKFFTNYVKYWMIVQLLWLFKQDSKREFIGPL